MEDLQKDNEVISLKKIIIDYIGQWKLFVACGIISVLLSIVYLAFYPKTYETIARIKIQEEKDLTGGGSLSLGDASGLMRSFGLNSSAAGGINVDDEKVTLLSNSLLSRVVKDLGLDVNYKYPYSIEDLYDETPVFIKLDSAFRANLIKKLDLKISRKVGNIIVEDTKEDKKYQFASLPCEVHLAEGVLSVSENPEFSVKDFSLEVTIRPVSWVAADFSEQIEVEEFSKTSNVLEIFYQDYNQKRAKDLLNRLMSIYNEKNLEVRKKENDETEVFLSHRIDNTVSQLLAVEKDIEEYKLKNRMTDIEYDVQFYAEAMKVYREKIIELEAQNLLVNMLDEYIKDPENKYKIVPAVLSTTSGDGENPVSLYNEALLEREKMQKTSNKDNPLATVLDKQLDKLREGVLVSVSNARKSSEQIMNDLKSKESEILKQMGNVPTYEREYIDLKRQQEILQGVYLILLQKREEIALSNGNQQEKGFITDEAYVNYKPVAPRKLFAAIFIFLFTLVTPVIILFAKKQGEELWQEYRNRNTQI